MKKLIVMGIIALMITGLSVAANAYAGVTLNVAPVYDGGSFQTVQLGWLTDDGTGAATTNAKDATVDGANGLTAMAGQVEMDIVNSVIAGSKVNGDWRAPVKDVATNAQVWRLKVTMPTYPVDEFDQTVYSAINFGITASFTPGMGLTNNAKLYILNGSFTTTAAAKTATTGTALLWTAPVGESVYNSAAGAFTIPMPTYDADNDIWITTGSVKYFTVFAEGVQAPTVPEPGSMLAMLSGLVGLVGFGIRRRK